MDKEEFEFTVNKYADDLFKIAFRYVCNRNDAEDIVQETFLKYLKHYKELQSEEHRKYWLMRVTINKSRDLLKSFWHKNITELEDKYISKDVGDSTVLHYVNCLKADDKIVIQLYYLDGYSIKEIAQILKKNESTIGNRLARARNKLKKMMEDDGYGK
ncbi:MAG: RNA polymerase sigma factor [Clostridium sp.]|nr:RNA polymerase sigma factor [Clostridium sp.]MCM1207871.1 RNA polymerase sigma factor [Ruminococcus sp.]